MSSTPNYKRLATGILAISFLMLGIFLYLQDGTTTSRWAGSWIRAGALLGAFWLAFPQLEYIQQRLPAIITGSLLVCVLIVTARPNIGRIVLTVVAIAVSINGVLVWLKPKSAPSPTKTKRRPRDEPASSREP